MTNRAFPSGTVVTWVVHFQNRWSLLASSFSLSSSLTLKKLPPPGHRRGRSAIVQNRKAHLPARNNNRGGEEKEGGSGEDKSGAGTCNLKRKGWAGHFRGLAEPNELKTKPVNVPITLSLNQVIYVPKKPTAQGSADSQAFPPSSRGYWRAGQGSGLSSRMFRGLDKNNETW